MSCICQKLQIKQYDHITECEAEILRRAWTEAPHLFLGKPTPQPPDIESPAVQTPRSRAAPSSAPRVPKRPRTLSGLSSHSLIPDRDRDQPLLAISTSLQSTRTATNLVGTYSYQNALRIIGKGDGLDIHQRNGSCGVLVEVFIAYERSNQKIETQQLFRRICSYAFAQLHHKSSSVDPIVREIEDALPHAENARTKVYHILRIGTKWATIVEQLASIVNRAPQQLTGLICLLGSPSAWERALPEDCQSALAKLCENTDICSRTLEFTPLINRVLNQILLQRSFVDEARMLPWHSESLLPTMTLSQSSRSYLQPRIEYPWKPPSLAALSQVVPGSSGIYSEDAGILLVLLSFLLTSEKFPLDLLFRGATPRRRWTVQGQIEEMDAVRVGLAPELGSFLSDLQRLENAFHELNLSSALSKNSDQSYSLDEAVAGRVREGLSPEDTSFWRRQALILAFRAIPWKYIESATPNIKIFLSHLQHALQACKDCFEHLPASTRADLVLTLIEASRFPNLAWKRFAVGQAEVAARGQEDRYLGSCIAQSQCVLSRISGNMDQAISSLGDLSQGRLSRTMDKRMHSAIGHTIIQRSLNCVQVEDLSTAKNLLEAWSPLDQNPSPMEGVVLFRKDMVLGRVLRFQGAFEESLTHLERARTTAVQRKDLVLDEDLRDLTCDLGDTLRELDDLQTAQHHLGAEIARQGQNLGSSPGGSLLELSLAEVLFAQERFTEAERLCLDVQYRAGLLKFEKLRLHITLAKIRHRDSDDEASSYWAKAMVAISKFPNESGATRIIVMSVCDILSRQRASDAENTILGQSRETLVSLGQLAKPGGVRCWIAGLRHWVECLESRGSSRL